MKFNELSDSAKYHATLVFNSEYDAYGVNGTRDYAPYTVEEFGEVVDTIYGFEFDENGDRINY